MKVRNDPRVDKKIRFLPLKESAKIVSVIELFEVGGFSISELYLKKLRQGLWEFRAGRWRLLFGVIDNEGVIVNMFLKKTQKAPKKEVDLALRRLNEYEK